MTNQEPITFSVTVLEPGTDMHRRVAERICGMKPLRKSHLPIPPIPPDVALTLVVLPVVSPGLYIRPLQWAEMAKVFDDLLAYQHCLDFGRAPKSRDFGDPEGRVCGYSRIHWFTHWSIAWINHVKDAILDSGGQDGVTDRILHFGPHHYTVVYTGRPVHSDRFPDQVVALWNGFNAYLEGHGPRPTLAPCCSPDCQCGGTEPIARAAS